MFAVKTLGVKEFTEKAVHYHISRITLVHNLRAQSDNFIDMRMTFQE